MSKEFQYDTKKIGKLYPVIKPFTMAFIKFMYKVRFVGRENIPSDRGFILASNHLSTLDPVFLIAACPQKVYFMGKKELFQKPFQRWFFTGMNSFPVNRAGADTKAITFAETLLKDGNVLGIFPEGTRSKTLEPQRAKGGIALIARATGADVLPVSIYFAEKPHFRSRLTVRFGELIPNASLELPEGERDTAGLRAAAAAVMERITELWAQKHA